MEKLKISLIGAVLLLTVYNTVQIAGLSTPKKEIVQHPMAAAANASPQQVDLPGHNIPTQAPKPEINLPVTSVIFEKEVHDFGTVGVTSENKYSFIFKNTGNAPLTISNARGSCGCTVPNWPKHPIAPGQTGTIDVVYKPNQGQAGQAQEKTVTVTANTEPANTIIKIKAQVADK